MNWFDSLTLYHLCFLLLSHLLLVHLDYGFDLFLVFFLVIGHTRIDPLLVLENEAGVVRVHEVVSTHV